MIAPGMCITFEIQFQSDSFKEYIDKITIISEFNAFEIPIVARRAPPILNLPSILECKSCWVGETSQQVFKITNKGGDAGFRFFEENEEETHNQQENNPDVLKTGNFEIYPCEFYLQKNETIEIIISFTPKFEGIEEKNVILACDSHIHALYTIKGSGNMCFLQICQIDNMVLEQQQTLNRLFFSNAESNIMVQRKVKIQNVSDVQVKFHWNIFEDQETFFQQNSKNSFQIFPQKGAFAAKETKEFTFEFLTDKPFPIYENALFYIDDIPYESIKNVNENIVKYMKKNKNSSLQPSFLGANSSRPSIPYIDLELIGLSTYTEIQLNKPFYIFPEDLQINKPYEVSFTIKNNSKATVNLKILEEQKTPGVFTEIKTQVEKIEGQKEKEIKVFFGSKLLGNNQKAILKIESDTTLVQTFEILANFSPQKIRLKQPIIDFGLMKVYEQKSIFLEIQNTSDSPQQVFIKNLKESSKDDLQLYPSLLKLQEIPDFSLFFDDQEANQDTPQEKKHAKLTIQQKNITILPNSIYSVEVTLQAQDAESFMATLEIVAEQNDPLYINVQSEIQDIQVSLNCFEVQLAQLFANKKVVIEKEIYLQNLGNINTKFEWNIGNIEQFQVTLEPKEGIIKAKEKKKLRIEILPQKGGTFEEILQCKVEGQTQLLGIVLKGQIFALQAEIQRVYVEEEEEKVKGNSLLNNNENLFNSLVLKSNIKNSILSKSMRQSDIYLQWDEQEKARKKKKSVQIKRKELCEKIDFFNCIINQPRHVYIQISNKSGISTHFTISSTKYQPFVPKNQSQENQSEKNTKTQFLLTAEIEKTQNFNSKQGQELNAQKTLEKEQQIYLQNNKGFALLPIPEKAKLSAYENVLIKLTLFNDVSGITSDILNINIEGLPKFQIPINISVEGSPVIVSPYQLGINYENKIPLYHLGYYLQNTPEIKREFKIMNTGPKSIRVNWKLYNLGANNDSDFFNISFINPIRGSSDICKVNFESIPPQEALEGPFKIYPQEEIINGREEKKFQVTFYAQNQGLFNSVLIAKPELVENVSNDWQIEDLALYLKAKTQEAYLTIDKIPKGKSLKLEKWAINEGNNKETKTLTLKNEDFPTLKFQVEVEGPFQIENIFSNSNQNFFSFQNSLLKNLSKNPSLGNQSFPKSIFSIEQNAQISLKIKYNGPLNGIWPQSYKSYEYGKLYFQFSNGDSQCVDIEGKLLRPNLKLNFTGFEDIEGEQVQDFGIVHISNTQQICLYLSNDSKVTSNWKICHVKNPFKKYSQNLPTMTQEDHENNNTTDDFDVFSFSKTEGSLKGTSIPILKWPETLALPGENTLQKNIQEGIVPEKVWVKFNPKKNVLYKSKFKICVQEGPQISFILRGQGTYEEEYKI